MESFRVTATSLHLRSKPVVAPSTKIAILHYGHAVDKTENSTTVGWWKVITVLDGQKLEGYVHSQYLEPAKKFVAPVASNSITAVHLTTTKPVGRDSGGRAFPLNEAAQPKRTATTSTDKVKQLHQIVDWLAVEKSPRYLPKGSTTYCNIYAYDFCYLANIYIPRVWWSSKALLQLEAGQHVTAKYDETVQELNANSLFNWFASYGSHFGWQRSFDLTEVQRQANAGAVCVISARRRDRNAPGHICLVVPETAEYQATRRGEIVSIPVQSNAGATNFRYGGKAWWTSDKFDGFSFWIHN